MKIGSPPVALVETWIQLVRTENIDMEVRNRASKMLKEKIGDTVDILAYVKKHNLKIK
ncbi:MAG: hypothetical protein ACTJIB_10430 [Pseudoalteromonas prydzensis]|uniref:hypothetical protein n=1 Tax=Pseudoalteromonas prydzensis TaxID=182141 RepID=UPI003F9D143F